MIKRFSYLPNIFLPARVVLYFRYVHTGIDKDEALPCLFFYACVSDGGDDVVSGIVVAG